LREFFRRQVLHNLALKITSLLLATGLWLAVSSSPPSEVALNVAVIFRNMPADLEISSENIPGVQIRVRGPQRIVRRLQPSDLRAEINLSGMKPGEDTFDLTKAIGVPDGLEVVQVVPSEVHLVFDARARRRVPVRARVVGTFMAGYRIGEIKTEPDSVLIIGPKKKVDSVESAITDAIDISGVLDEITVLRPAYVSDPLIQVPDPTPVRITITMQKGSVPLKQSQ
jgi:YbbR domain-containing protein